ncbi:probable cytochrome P450 6a14 isoform X2 [Phymastichus coffea]|nr:probable cytochrome P450 6a14 isoform X2 [Phymastichus coffea]
MKRSYRKFKKYPFHGLYVFYNPVLMINDPELIRNVLVKDFTYFCDRGLYSNHKCDPLSAHIFLLNGDVWRTMRAKLSPSFTSGKLKQMFPILKNIADEMIKVINENLSETDNLELKDLIARYTTDTIFSLAFGLDSYCLRNPDNIYRHYGQLLAENSIVRAALGFFAPCVLDFFRIPLINPQITSFFVKLFQDMVDQRRAGKISRKDFLGSLMDLMDYEQMITEVMGDSVNGINEEKIARRLEPLEAIAQAIVFFLAGFETSSSIATHCIYELALNPDVQDKLYEEIFNSNKNCNELTYEVLMELKYLDMTFHETMRKHPSVPFLNRVCVKDYQVPNSNFIIEKGTRIIISVSGIHDNEDIHSDPQKFDPMRFSKENIASQNTFSYLPFGQGPRSCISKGLGKLQTKMVLFHLILHYKFSLCNKTPVTAEYATESIFQTPKNGIYLKVDKRKIAL